MKIAILGTRGIPNNYGGFEQFAEYLSVDLYKRGIDVYVYNSHNHSYQEKVWNGVNIIHQFDPEFKIGTAGQFIYDLNCILDCRKQQFDVIIQLGYTSSSVWSFLFPKKSTIITNMDGLEWKRTKYGKWTQKFLSYAEKLAVKKSDYLIADSLGIQSYLLQKYNVASTYIPYGANIFNEPNQELIKSFNLEAYQYDLLIARLEPENSLDIILEGVRESGCQRKFIVVGNHKTKYGEYLKTKYQATSSIIFLGSIYDMPIVNNLRYFSNLYFHGHTVGGTNPSLLEAMASQGLIVANNNDFNASILGKDAFYFNHSKDVSEILKNTQKINQNEKMLTNNMMKIEQIYNWENINSNYYNLINKIKKDS